MSILNEIKESFKSGSALIKLIYINVGVFLAVNILYAIFYLVMAMEPVQKFILTWFALPADPEQFIIHPWSLISYMFLHESFIHILFNMLWLYWFGAIFQRFLSQQQLVGVYIFGGIAGAAAYLLTFNIFPVFEEAYKISYALGASAAVLAVISAIAFFKPDYRLNLVFIGPVKIIYLALIMIVVTSFVDFSINTGGKVAHLGGALYGWIYAVSLRRGKDFTAAANKFLYGLFVWKRTTGRKSKMKVSYKKPKNDMDYMAEKAVKQEEINRILDKIAKSGYDSLTKQEKETLFRESNKN